MRYVFIVLAGLGLFGILAYMGWLQGAATTVAGYQISWAMGACGLLGLIGFMKVRT